MKYTIDTAVEAMDRANPVPDPESLADAMARASVFLMTERTKPMDTREQTAPKQSTNNRNRQFLTAAAAFAVIVVVGLVSLVAINRTSQDATTGMTDREVAEAFVAARGEGNVEASKAVMAADAQIDDNGLATDRLSYYDMVAWLGALEWEWEITDCTEEAYGPDGTHMVCSYQHNNAWGRALGVGPFDDGGTFEITVENGEITAFNNRWRETTFSPQVWEVFGDWLLKNHLDQIDTVLSDGCCTPIMTSEALAVWRSLTEEYVAELTS